jgi:hypothetical protein
MTMIEAPPGRPLNRSTPVPRELVHRTALAEVLLTDVRRAGEHRFAAAAQWPRSHPTFDRAGDGRHNPLMVAETLRELGICIPLQYYAVAPDSHLLIGELEFSIDPAAEPRARYAGSEITCNVRADRFRPVGHSPPRSLGLTALYRSDGRQFARAQGIARILSAAAYRAVRGRDTSAAASTAITRPAPDLVGVAQAQDVLIGADWHGRVRLLPADPYHPFFYDHPSDHVPGLVVLEAVRQAVAWHLAGAPARLVSCELRALRFTEAEPPAHITHTAAMRPTATNTGTTGTGAALSCEFEVWQQDALTAAGSLGFATPRGA